MTGGRFGVLLPTDRVPRRILYDDEANDGGKISDMYVWGANLEFNRGRLLSTSLSILQHSAGAGVGITRNVCV
jgi:hypothetical protein